MKPAASLETQSTERLRQHIEVLAELFGERNTSHLPELEATRAYLRHELEAMGHMLQEQPFEVFDRRAMNLEVVLPGSRPDLPTLIIGAHYDSAPGTPGADDNASAVAIALEISRHLLECRRCKRTIRVVFYDCEEPPYFNLGEMGSQFHAAGMRRSGEPIFGMICLESLGFFPTTRESRPGLPLLVRVLNRLIGQQYVVIVSDIRSALFGWSFVWRFATSGFFRFLPAALPVKLFPEITLSDHRGYWEQGFSALMITDTAMLRNPNYHRSSDRLATIDLNRMTSLCRQLQRTVSRLAR